MDTLNLYWWSDMASEVGKLEPRGCGEEKAEMEKWICHVRRREGFGKRKTAAL
jgi:hypothetical protein